jgi:activator of HSP90 ATPase
MPKNIKQKVTLDGKPHDVFEILMDEKKHAELTGSPATVDRAVGGWSLAYEGELKALNLDVVKDKRIVQAWRSEGWKDGEWSIATFEFAPARGGKTTLTFTQTGVPDKHVKDIAEGWKLYYWGPMKTQLAK